MIFQGLKVLILKFVLVFALLLPANAAPSDVLKYFKKSAEPPVVVTPKSRTTAQPNVIAPPLVPKTTRQPSPSAKGSSPQQSGTWQQNQANHAWTRRSDDFQIRGINSPEELQAFAREMRRNPEFRDYQALIAPDRATDHIRFAYGKLDRGSTKKGIVVIDNPADPVNGGTIMNVKNIYTRIDNLK